MCNVFLYRKGDYLKRFHKSDDGIKFTKLILAVYIRISIEFKII